MKLNYIIKNRVAEMMIAGPIGSYDEAVNGMNVFEAVTAAERDGADSFLIRINSGGGSVFEGLSIYNTLKDRNCEIVIEGIAASIASVIACAGKTVTIRENAFLMIHNPWTFAGGDERELKKVQENLVAIKKSIMLAYTQKSGMDEAELKALMDDETWFTAEQALEKKFVDKIDGRGDPAVSNLADALSQYSNSIFSQTKKDPQMDIIKALRAKFGIAETVADAVIVDAVHALFTEQQETLSTAQAGLQTANQRIADLNAKLVTAEANLSAIDTARRTSIVEQAIADTRITAAERDIWLDALQKDEAGTVAKLNARSPMNQTPPAKPKGKSGGKPNSVIRQTILNDLGINND